MTMSIFTDDEIKTTGKHRIYTFKADTRFCSWDEIIAHGDTVTVEEFETYEDAVSAYDDRYNDPDVYGVE